MYDYLRQYNGGVIQLNLKILAQIIKLGKKTKLIWIVNTGLNKMAKKVRFNLDIYICIDLFY